MMGLGTMGMASWISGAIAVAIIWGSLWWLLTTLGNQPRHRHQSPGLPPPPSVDRTGPSAGTQQPTHARPSAVAAPLADARGSHPGRTQPDGESR